MRSRHTIALASLIALCAIASCSNTHQDNAVEPLDPANYPTTPDTTTTTPGSQTTTTTTASSTTTPPTDTTTAVTSLSGQPGIDVPDSVKQDLIQAYQKSIAALYAASSPPNPNHPALAETTTGASLDKTKQLITSLVINHEIGYLPSPTKSFQRLEVVRAYNETHAEIEVCTVDDGIRARAGTGEILDSDIVTARSIVVLQREGYVWKRSESAAIAKEADAKCA